MNSNYYLTDKKIFSQVGVGFRNYMSFVEAAFARKMCKGQT